VKCNAHRKAINVLKLVWARCNLERKLQTTSSETATITQERSRRPLTIGTAVGHVRRRNAGSAARKHVVYALQRKQNLSIQKDLFEVSGIDDQGSDITFAQVYEIRSSDRRTDTWSALPDSRCPHLQVIGVAYFVVT